MHEDTSSHRLESVLRVLLVEDSDDDALLIVAALRRSGYSPTVLRVETEEQLTAALDSERWDIVLADYALPIFDAPAALRVIQQRGLDLPLIIVSGSVSAETAVVSMRAGASDFLPKDDLTRLVPALEREVRDARRRAAGRAAEKAQWESEARYRSLFAHSHDAIFLVGAQGHIVDANPAALALSGYCWDELAQLPIQTLYRAQDERTAYPAEAIGDDAALDVHTHVRRKDGTIHDVVITSSPWYADDGAPLGMFHIVRDVTERKQGELARRQLAAIVEASQDAIVGNSLDGIITSWNAGAERLYGYGGDEILGRSIDLLIHHDRVDEIPTMFDKIRHGEHITAYETVRVRKDGTTVPVSITVSPIRDEHGVTIGASMIARDFTERKQAEETLRRAVDRLHHLHAIDLRILALQPPEAIAAAAVVHIRKLIPCAIAALWSIDGKPETLTLLAADPEQAVPSFPDAWLDGRMLKLPAQIRNGQPLLLGDMRDGKELAPGTQTTGQSAAPTQAVVPLRSPDGVLGILMLTASDRTDFTAEHLQIALEVADRTAVALHNTWLFEQVRAGRTRQQHLARRVIEVQEAERRFLAFELHDEIGQVLTAVKMNLQTLVMNPHALDVSTRLADSIAIVNTAMEQTRTLALTLRPALLDELGLTSALRWYLDQQAQRAGLSICIDLNPGEVEVPDEIASTCFRIAQEAITNVIRHAQARHVELTLHGDGTAVHLLIRDDGVGFDTVAVRARTLQGGSLGTLSMAERAELIGGVLTIDSRPGEGTVVRADLPLFFSVNDDTSAALVFDQRR